MTLTVTYATTVLGPPDGDFQTNGYQSGAQFAPEVLGVSGGGFVSAYDNPAAFTDFVATNFYDADRTLYFGATWFTAGGATDAGGQPKLAELAGGNVIVLWDENATADGDAGPHATVFNQQGMSVTGQIDLNLFGDNDAAYRDLGVAALDDGGIVVSYVYGGGVFFRLFDSSFAALGGSFSIDPLDGVGQEDLQVVTLSDGAFALTWTDASVADQLIRGRIYESDGTARTAEFDACFGGGDNTHSSIAALNDGGFAVVYKDTGWSELGTPDDPGITLHVVDAAGVVGPYIHVNAERPGEESDPDVTVLENGFIAVTWTYPFSATDTDIYCRVFDPAGAPVTDQFVIAGETDDETASAVSAMLGGQFITSWQTARPDADGGSIYSQMTELTREVVGDGARDKFSGDVLRDHVDGGAGADKLSGAGGDDAMFGGDGSDKLKGQSGNDTLEGGFHTDVLNGGVGNDVLWANDAANTFGDTNGDALNGANGNDTLHGSYGADTLVGLAGKDVLDGMYGNDTVSGGSGKDVIRGGTGGDLLTGGGDKDTFVYDDITDASLGSDLITDLGNLDRIDLSGIDAKSGNPGDQAFTLVAAFGGHRGELVVAYVASGPSAGNTTIQGDVDGDGSADFTIYATGDRHNFSNFVL